MRLSRSSYIGLSLALITVATFWPAVHHGFINYDDGLYVTARPIVQEGLTFKGILWAFTHLEACNWHPLTWLSHMLDCTLFQLFPGGHHLTSILLHAVNAVLLFLVLQKMTGTTWRSAMVAGLFAWHPLHVESVAWVAERKDVLSTLFLILTLGAYLRYVTKPAAGNYAMVVLWFAFGLMSKAMLVTLPLLLLALDYWPLHRFPGNLNSKPDPGAAWRKALLLIKEKIPLLVMSLAIGILTIIAQGEAGAIQPLDQLPISARLSNAVTAYAAYLGMTFWPADLALLYPLDKHLPFATIAMSLGVLMGITFLALREIRNAPHLAVGWCWFLVSLLPVIGLLQVGEQAMADRYTYIPLIGIFVASVWICASWCARLRLSSSALATVSGAVLLACLVSTRGQLLYWRDSVTLFRNTVEVTRHNLGAHYVLGLALSDQGRREEAIAQFNRVLGMKSDWAAVHYSLSMEYLNHGQTTQAIHHLKETLRLNPAKATAHNNLGGLLAQQQRYAEAIPHFLQAVKLQPDYDKAHLNLAEALARQGRHSEAFRHFGVANGLRPDWPQALAAWAKALTAPETLSDRERTHAVELAQRACALTQNGDPDYLRTLAAAYAAAGQFADATLAAEKALNLAQSTAQQDLAQSIRDDLKSYTKRKAAVPRH